MQTSIAISENQQEHILHTQIAGVSKRVGDTGTFLVSPLKTHTASDPVVCKILAADDAL